MVNTMKWHSSISTSNSLEKSIRDVVTDIKRNFSAKTADLGLLFVSSYFRQEVVDLWPMLQKELPIRHLLGCTAGGVIGGGNEVEMQPALSLTVAELPNVKIVPFQIQQAKIPDADARPRAWQEALGVDANDQPQFLLLSDPFSIDADALIAGMDFAFPKSVKVGGLASGGLAAKDNLLFLDEKVIHNGAVGVALSGKIVVDAVVAQGCRPIGERLSVTACDDNILVTVNNQPPLNYLQELYEKLGERDRNLLHHSLFLGVVMDPFKNEPKQGDFLIRNILGLDQQQGLLAVGTKLRPGQTVQFHLRDASTSKDDLRLMLSKCEVNRPQSAETGAVPVGAVLFSCVGRGQNLYGESNHDTGIMRSFLGNIPIGGFFCNGEIGPVGGKTYLHGYTSSIAVFSTPNRVTAKSDDRSVQNLII